MMRSVREPDPSVTLCVAQPGDFEELALIRIEAMRASLERLGRFDPVRARERLAAGFSAEHTRHIVLGGERVGFVVVKRVGDALSLDHLYLKPGAQSRGVGSAVLAQVIAEAEAAGLPLRVGALRESDSNRFYARHGFSLVEQTEYDNHYVRPNRRTGSPASDE
jgi:GNAT superfamily N-acetyltransferase